MLTKKQRLQRLSEVLDQLTDGIRLVREALQASEPTDACDIADTLLSQLGWLAERARTVAYEKSVPIVGDVDDWLLGRGHALVRGRDEP
jgi:hypothetical protein